MYVSPRTFLSPFSTYRLEPTRWTSALRSQPMKSRAGFELPVPREIRFGFRGLVFALRFVAEGDRLYVEHYHGHTGQFIIGAVFKKGTGRDPDSFLGLLSGPR